MKVAVCEDSYDDMQRLKRAIAEVDAQLQLSVETDCYGSGEELLEAVKDGRDYHLIFMDIYMKDMNGVQTAKEVRALLPEVQIAFLTTSREFMLDAFDLNALHYLMKPVQTNGVRECMERFYERSREPLEEMILKTVSREYRFPMMHVQKVISHNKGIDVYQQNLPPVHIPMSFATAEKQLNPSFFLKISRGYIVHMSYIRYINNTACYLKDGAEILISRNDKVSIRKRYNDYLFQR